MNNQLLESLRELYEENPQISEVNLQFKHINNLLPLLHILKNFKHLRKLNLHGNNLKQLPTDLSMLESIEQLDISNNMLNDVDMVIISLKTLPKLRSLKYPINKNKVKKIVEQLKPLKQFNGTKVIRQLSKKDHVLTILTDKNLQGYKFRKLAIQQQKYLETEIDPDQENKFRQELQLIASEALEKIRGLKQRASQSLENLIFAHTKHEMYQFLKIRCLNLCYDIYSDLGLTVKSVVQEQDKLFKGILEQSYKLCQIQYDIKQAEEEKKKNVDADPEQRFYQKMIFLEKQVKRLRKVKEQLITEINQLQNSNTRYIQTLVKFSKGERVYGFDQNKPLKAHSGKINAYTNNNFTNKNPTHGVVKFNPIDKSAKFAQKQTIPVNYSTNSRSLTLKQLKDTIEQIYQSKLKYDQKSFDGKLPRQTMHKYLFIYLNQKYGLKSLTIQAANSIVSGIQTYSSEDNDVAVFGKILRNEIDEEYRMVQAELKATINDLLKMQLQAKQPYKNANQINQILAQKINGDIFWQDCLDLITYLYDTKDSQIILKKLQLLIKLNRTKQQNMTRRTIRGQNATVDKNKKKIKFHQVLQCVLNFQMRNHERLLKPLVNMFKVYDRDSDGIINQQQFIELIQKLCENANQLTAQFLNIVDPYETKSITFTQVVRLLANYPEGNPILGQFLQNKQAEEQGQEAQYAF